jgi:hypothetical protein
MVSGNLSYLTAAMFVRRDFIAKNDLFFNPRMRAAGDTDWTLRLLKSGARMGVMRSFLSVFTETSANLGRTETAIREAREIFESAPRWAQKASNLVIGHYRTRRFLAGLYRCSPHDYAIYTRESPTKRQHFHVANPTFRWVRA